MCVQTVVAKLLSEHTKSIYNLYIIIILDLWPHDITIKRGFYSKRITYFFGERFSFIIKFSLLHEVVICQTSLCAWYDDRNQYFAILWLSVFINKNAYITHLGCVNYITYSHYMYFYRKTNLTKLLKAYKWLQFNINWFENTTFKNKLGVL